VKTLELYEEEVLVLILKEKKYNHDYSTKGHDLVTQVYLLTSNPLGLKQKKLDTDSFLGEQK